MFPLFYPVALHICTLDTNKHCLLYRSTGDEGSNSNTARSNIAAPPPKINPASTAKSSVVNLDVSYNLSLESSSSSLFLQSNQKQPPTTNKAAHNVISSTNTTNTMTAMERLNNFMNLLSDDDDDIEIQTVSKSTNPTRPNSAAMKVDDRGMVGTKNIKLDRYRSNPYKPLVSEKETVTSSSKLLPVEELNTSITPTLEKKDKEYAPATNTQFMSTVPAPAPITTTAASTIYKLDLLSSSPSKSKILTFSDDEEDEDLLALLGKSDSTKPARPTSLIRTSTEIDTPSVKITTKSNVGRPIGIRLDDDDSDLEAIADNVVLPSDSDEDSDQGMMMSNIRKKNNNSLLDDSSVLITSTTVKPSLKRKRDPANSSLLDSFEELDARAKQRMKNKYDKVEVPTEVTYKNGFTGSLLAELELDMTDDTGSVARRSSSDPGFKKRNYNMADLSSLAQPKSKEKSSKLTETLSGALSNRGMQRSQTLTNAISNATSATSKSSQKTKEPAVRMTKEQREEFKQLQAQHKLNQKLFKTANKSKREKVELLNEMIINIPSELMDKFKTVDEYQEILKDIQINSRPQTNQRLVTFSRKATSFYNASVDLFYPKEPFIIHECVAALVYTAEDFLSLIEEGTVLSTFQNFQRENMDKISNLIIVIIGLDSLMSKIKSQHNRKHTALVRQQLQPVSETSSATASSNKRKKSKTNEISLTVEELEEAVTLLEVNSFKTFATKNLYDTLTRLRSFTYTISSSRYDKNERNPDFATIGTLKSGEDMDQSYLFMLQTLPIMTEPRAKRVMEKIPTFRKLYEMVERGRALVGNDGKNLFPGSIDGMVRRIFSSDDEEQLLRNQI
ncbi:hypothetical protein WICPIJ_006507 [Wickerhamomyces pijperi]|uniref:ERCC4 domain-containing protein n=1 Tax=Wickerhamomyces pijperi TaxID=599730 RepID=A0A9P8TKT2_WICPI|nr:hypothetical protein WICPIJ_006507 [Wickerhamomyces pijperi]